MKVSKGGKGQSQPEIVAAAFLILYMVLGRPGFDCDSQEQHDQAISGRGGCPDGAQVLVRGWALQGPGCTGNGVGVPRTRPLEEVEFDSLAQETHVRA